jgi:hypothetical protein
MSIDVHEQLEIHRPREEVAAFASDPLNDPTWIGGIREASWVTEPPLRLGSRVRRIATFAGRRIDYVLEVTGHEPLAKIEMTSVRSPFPMVVTYTFDDAGAGTRAAIRVQGGSGAAFRLFAPLIAWQVGRNVHGDLERLKALLERS